MPLRKMGKSNNKKKRNLPSTPDGVTAAHVGQRGGRNPNPMNDALPGQWAGNGVGDGKRHSSSETDETYQDTPRPRIQTKKGYKQPDIGNMPNDKTDWLDKVLSAEMTFEKESTCDIGEAWNSKQSGSSVNDLTASSSHRVDDLSSGNGRQPSGDDGYHRLTHGPRFFRSGSRSSTTVSPTGKTERVLPKMETERQADCYGSGSLLPGMVKKLTHPMKTPEKDCSKRDPNALGCDVGSSMPHHDYPRCGDHDYSRHGDPDAPRCGYDSPQRHENELSNLQLSVFKLSSSDSYQDPVVGDQALPLKGDESETTKFCESVGQSLLGIASEASSCGDGTESAPIINGAMRSEYLQHAHDAVSQNAKLINMGSYVETKPQTTSHIFSGNDVQAEITQCQQGASFVHLISMPIMYIFKKTTVTL